MAERLLPPQAVLAAEVLQQVTATPTQRELFYTEIAQLQVLLRVLELEQKLFVRPFKQQSYDLQPFPREDCVAIGCIQGKYKGHLEGLFYDVGGVRLVGALLVAVRLTPWVFKEITDLPPAAQWQLATLLKENRFPEKLEKWSKNMEAIPQDHPRMFFSLLKYLC